MSETPGDRHAEPTPLDTATDADLFDELCRRHPEVLLAYSRDGEGVGSDHYSYICSFGGTKSSWATAIGLATFAFERLKKGEQHGD